MGTEDKESSLFNGLWAKSRLIPNGQEDARFDHPIPDSLSVFVTFSLHFSVTRDEWLVSRHPRSPTLEPDSCNWYKIALIFYALNKIIQIDLKWWWTISLWRAIQWPFKIFFITLKIDMHSSSQLHQPGRRSEIGINLKVRPPILQYWTCIYVYWATVSSMYSVRGW